MSDHDVADKFIAALKKVGVKVTDVTPEDSDAPYMYYKIIPPNEVPLDKTS